VALLMCKHCGANVSGDLPYCGACGQPIDGSEVDNPMSVIIPYKNASALVGYYLGLFSLVPCLGLVLAIPAFILGILGWKKAQSDPLCHGKAHAIVAMVGPLLSVGGISPCGCGPLNNDRIPVQEGCCPDECGHSYGSF